MKRISYFILILCSCSSPKTEEQSFDVPIVDTTFLNGDTIMLTFKDDIERLNNNFELETIDTKPYEYYFKKGEEFFYKTVSYDSLGNVDIITYRDSVGNGKVESYYKNGELKSRTIVINDELIEDSKLNYHAVNDSTQYPL